MVQRRSPPGCTECTSCHFCRQKTTDIKTTCQCARWRKTPPGGRGRARGAGGAWRCAWARTSTRPSRTPSGGARCAATSCNCSEEMTPRQARLFPTQQLTHEAIEHGWQSVAHYLITTRIVAGADAQPMILDLFLARATRFELAPSAWAAEPYHWKPRRRSRDRTRAAPHRAETRATSASRGRPRSEGSHWTGLANEFSRWAMCSGRCRVGTLGVHSGSRRRGGGKAATLAARSELGDVARRPDRRRRLVGFRLGLQRRRGGLSRRTSR